MTGLTNMLATKPCLTAARMAALLLVTSALAAETNQSNSSAGPGVGASSTSSVPLPTAKPAKVRQIDWDELLPTEERGSLGTEPPPPIHDYLGGGPPAQQSGSFNVNPALDGAAVKIPGYVVPIHVAGDGLVSEFLLVPYVGACIHVPPPPPNQIVYVRFAKGVKVKSLADAQLVTGRMRTDTKYSHVAAAAYMLDADKVEPFDY
jgi:uncharacterized protein